jgi:hypothetical protein
MKRLIPAVLVVGVAVLVLATSGGAGKTSKAAAGQGLNQFGADWYVLAPSGDKIDNG